MQRAARGDKKIHISCIRGQRASLAKTMRSLSAQLRREADNMKNHTDVIRVAVYCRVSTDKLDQANSLESQQRFFDAYISRNPLWELVEIYVDEGITGTNTLKRENFNSMVQDGKDGKFDMIITIGPLIMMKFVTLTAKPYGVPVTVSMNPIMIDGTGMCGGCRLTLLQDGKRVTKFACVDGPDFNGYEVDFDEAMSRGRTYFDFERKAHEKVCNLFKGV